MIAARQPGKTFIDTPEETRIRQHYGDTSTWNFNQAAGATWFFIDGSHTYYYCRNDSEKCFELCQGKGVFLWHDCDFSHPGVIQFIKDWRKQGRDIVLIEGTTLAYWCSY